MFPVLPDSSALPHNAFIATVRVASALHKHLITLGFVGLYVALDAASFIHPLHVLNITPWNPAPALGLVFLLRRGPGARPVLVAAVLLSEYLVRGVPFPWWDSLLSALILAAGYLLLGEAFARRMPPSTLLGWMLPVVFGTLLNSLVYVSSLCLLGLLPWDGWSAGVVRSWVGDAVGITVAMPLFWWLSVGRGRLALHTVLRSWETLGHSLLGVVVLWIAFGLGGEGGFKLFYFLFLPIVWASVRQGMAGAIVSATVLQLGMIGAMQVLDFRAVTMAELQMLAVVIVLVGFFIGGVVDEQCRTSSELRQTLRLAAAGEMAGALAHELNQPLTAMGAYASAYDALQVRGETGSRLEAAINGMRAEARRAGEVVRRLRDFFHTGATRLEAVRLDELIAAATAHYHSRARQGGVAFEVAEVPALTLLADRLQLALRVHGVR